LIMQALLFCTTCAVLFVKKIREKSGRTWRVFLLDSSKQIVASGWMHVANMLCALAFATSLPGVDGCTVYAANIILDASVGLLVEWALLRGLHVCLVCLRFTAAAQMLDSGSYYDEQVRFRLTWYLAQLLVWLCIMTTMKASIVVLMWCCPWVEFSIDAILGGLDHSPKAKLAIVMVAIPVVMNTIAMVVTDMFIKKRAASTAAQERILRCEARTEPNLASAV